LPRCTRCTRCTAMQAMPCKAAGPGWLQPGNEAKASGCRTAVVVRPCSSAGVGSKSARQRCCRGLAAASGSTVRTGPALPLLLAGPASACRSQTPRRSLTAEAPHETNPGAERRCSSLTAAAALMPAWRCPLPGPVLALGNLDRGGDMKGICVPLLRCSQSGRLHLPARLGTAPAFPCSPDEQQQVSHLLAEVLANWVVLPVDDGQKSNSEAIRKARVSRGLARQNQWFRWLSG
jgi:hypothetical protein